MMKRSSSLRVLAKQIRLAFFLLFAPVIVSARSEEVRAQTKAKLVGGRVSFVVPRGLKKMSASQIGLKYRGQNKPTDVWADARAKTSIAASLSPQRLQPSQLPQLKSVLEKQMTPRVPGLRWIKREIITLNGRKWINFEFISQAVDTKIHNNLLFTSFNGRMLLFNFNATVDLWNRQRAALLQSRNSIRAS